MKDNLIPLRLYGVYCKEVAPLGSGPEEPIQNVVRTYPYSPGLMALQIRAYAQTSKTGAGKDKFRNMMAGATLDVEMAKQLVEQLNEFIQENV